MKTMPASSRLGELGRQWLALLLYAWNRFRICTFYITRFGSKQERAIQLASRVRVNLGADKVSLRSLQNINENQTVFTDGCCLNSNAGVGLYYGPGNPFNLAALINGRADNNRAELAALLLALLQHPQDTPVTLVTDSRWALKIVSRFVKLGHFGANDSSLARFMFWVLYFRKAKTTFRRVSAHSGHTGNETADKLARIACEKFDTKQIPRLFVPKPACKSVQRLADLVFRMHYPSAWQEQSKPSQDHQKQTKASLGPRSAGKELTNHLGLDCEMVGCRKDGEFSILARVCIVNSNGQVLYDTFVSPTERVTDYRTHVSGVRPTDLLSAPTFEKVQKRVQSIVQGRIIVGHGLENDFAVLHYVHPEKDVRDTAAYRPLCKRSGRPRSLKALAQMVLKSEIQSASHDPAEDARAAMYIYQAMSKKWERSVERRWSNISE